MDDINNIGKDSHLEEESVMDFIFLIPMDIS